MLGVVVEMNLYLLERVDAEFMEVDAVILIAYNTSSAIDLVHNYTGNDSWLNPTEVKITKISTLNTPDSREYILYAGRGNGVYTAYLVDADFINE